MASDTQDSPQLPEEARLRMRQWLTSPGLRAHLDQAIDTGRRPLRTGPYIALSREAGTGGVEIASLVAKRLNWDMLDKQLLDFMAECYEMPRCMLEFVDETRANWLHDVLSSWLDSQVVSHEKFVVYLQRIMFLAAMYGRIVFVGRGAHRVLPRPSGLAVRIVAPLEFRIARLMNTLGVPRKTAQRQIAQIDADRRDFYQRYFRHATNDAHEFDLTINVARMTQQSAAELIVEAFERIDRENSAPVSDSA